MEAGYERFCLTDKSIDHGERGNMSPCLTYDEDTHSLASDFGKSAQGLLASEIKSCSILLLNFVEKLLLSRLL